MEKLNKVALITVYFWIAKVLATTLGEILGDFFSMSIIGLRDSIALPKQVCLCCQRRNNAALVDHPGGGCRHRPHCRFCHLWRRQYGPLSIGAED